MITTKNTANNTRHLQVQFGKTARNFGTINMGVIPPSRYEKTNKGQTEPVYV